MRSTCLIFQRDRTVLLDTASPAFPEARDLLREFAELVHSSGAYHAYRITELALWSAAASGWTAAEITEALQRFGEHPPPVPLLAFIHEYIGRYGLLRLEGVPGDLHLVANDHALLQRFASEYDLEWLGDSLRVPDAHRGWLKSALANAGYPVLDAAQLSAARPLPFTLREDVHLRSYQRQAVEAFEQRVATGGVILLPCGAGKTIVGVAVAATLSAWTLVITPSRTIGEQWYQHFLDMTTLTREQIAGVGQLHTSKPVTIATYQALTSQANGRPATLGQLLDLPWGLIIYDEVHSLPADVFRQSAAVQSRRRLGLTATLVREDGRERDVFALVGPAVFSVPWRDLERRGWIAPVDCVEVRVQIPADERRVTADRVLAAKLQVLRRLLRHHAGDQVLIVAHRLVEVAAAARVCDAPMITGKTPAAERRARYDAFRRGEIQRLALSRVANVGVDLPDASVLIQISGTFGSRQEEAQRVGRLLRPKAAGGRATFYSLVSPVGREVDFAARRQRFLIDQGYRYQVVDGGTFARSEGRS